MTDPRFKEDSNGNLRRLSPDHPEGDGLPDTKGQAMLSRSLGMGIEFEYLERNITITEQPHKGLNIVMVCIPLDK